MQLTPAELPNYYAYRDALRTEFRMAGPEAFWLYWQKHSLADARKILDSRGRRKVKRRHPVIDRDEVDRRVREALCRALQDCLDNYRLGPDDLVYVRALLDRVATAV